MPLHDHFRGPLASHRHWTSFHAAWATYLSEHFNEHLPAGYFAEPLAQFAIEIDVATWEQGLERELTQQSPPGGWKPSPPQITVPFSLATDNIEVLLFRNEGGPVLAGAVELVSPANKDRPESREAFVSKCAAYLHQGVGLVVVDVVTERRADLHQLLLDRVAPEQPAHAQVDLYASAYRPVGRNGATSLDVWREALALGVDLPTMPLWLRNGPCLPVELEATYERTLRKQRVLTNGV